MEKKFESIGFCRDTYAGNRRARIEDESREYEKELFNDVKEFIRIATQNGYQCRVFDDGLTICVEYNYIDESMSGVSLEWLGEDEYIEKYANGKDSDDDASDEDDGK